MKKLIVIALLIGFASCSDDCPTPEKDLNEYYFKAIERYTRLEYNASGALFRTHAEDTILAEKTGISLEELTLLIEQYDLGLIQDIDEGVSVETWTYTLEYNLIRKTN